MTAISIIDHSLELDLFLLLNQKDRPYDSFTQVDGPARENEKTASNSTTEFKTVFSFIETLNNTRPNPSY
jgi:hypothetical protein